MKHYIYLHWKSASTALGRMLHQPFSSLLSLSMLALAITLPLTLYLIVMSAKDWAETITVTPEISLFMETSADNTDLGAIHSALQLNPAVQTYRFVSKAQALEEMEMRHDMPGLTQGLDENPLPDTFIVVAKTHDPAQLKQLEQAFSGLPMVAMVQYDANWAQKLFEIIQLAQKIVLVLAIVLGITLLLICHNMIRLQIFGRKEEIEVSKLIGAPDHFIRRPFLYFALWQGLAASLIAWGISYWFIREANPAIETFAQLYNETLSIRFLTPQELGVLFLLTSILSLAGAYLATNRHLRRFTP